MSVLEVLKRRRSVRSFVYQPIPQEDWLEILEAGRIAATSRNRQARRFVTITEPDRIKEFVQAAKIQEFTKEAAAIVVGCAPDINSTGVDVMISLTQMEAVAVSKGIGTIWLGTFDREVVGEQIKLPLDNKIVLLMAFGYPATPGNMPDKLPLGELFLKDTF